MIQVEGSPCHCDGPTCVAAAAAGAAAAVASAACGIQRLACDSVIDDVGGELLLSQQGLSPTRSEHTSASSSISISDDSSSSKSQASTASVVDLTLCSRNSSLATISRVCVVNSSCNLVAFSLDDSAVSLPQENESAMVEETIGKGLNTPAVHLDEHDFEVKLERTSHGDLAAGDQLQEAGMCGGKGQSDLRPPGSALALKHAEQANGSDGEIKMQARGSSSGVMRRNQLSGAAPGVPLFVMLPLDVVTRDRELRNEKALGVALQALKSAGVEGVMVDVWWGLVERDGPGIYNWAPYKALMQLVHKAGLLLQAVMSFHACGNNVGDNTHIPLPPWVQHCGAHDPAIYFRDRAGKTNPECISLFSDTVPCLAGRTPLQVYEDFMRGFKDAMADCLKACVCEVAVGMGPCGELRYPSYPEGDGRWRYPGIGEFQCYDPRALENLKIAAEAAGQPLWGLAGPHDAGQYNMQPHHTGFFRYPGGSWETPYGQFFLEWYSGALVAHQERMLQAAVKAFHGASLSVYGPNKMYKLKEGSVHLSVKCAGIHWWYRSPSHSAELTAGYYNPRGRNGYEKIIRTCKQYAAGLNFTCVEMRNCEQRSEAHSGPEELLKQVRVCAAQYEVPLAGENALPRLDAMAYEQILRNATGKAVVLVETMKEYNGESTGSSANGFRTVEQKVPSMASITFLRLTPKLFEEKNFALFMKFAECLKIGSESTSGIPESGKSSGQGKQVQDAREESSSACASSCSLAGKNPMETSRSPVGSYRGSFPSATSLQRSLPSRGSAEFPHYLGQRQHFSMGQQQRFPNQPSPHSFYPPIIHHSGGSSQQPLTTISPTHWSSSRTHFEEPVQDHRALSPIYLAGGRAGRHYVSRITPDSPSPFNRTSQPE